MLYLVLAVVLMITGAGLYGFARLKKQHLPRSSKIMFAIFFLLGLAMSSFALQEVSADHYQNIQTLIQEYPSLQSTVAPKEPKIIMYEYLEILEVYKALKKEAL